jgi:hypothetical protein
MQNVRFHDGEIKRSSLVVQGISTVPTISLNTENDVGNSKYGNGQTPMVIRTFQSGEYLLVVTNREIHWWNNSLAAWVNLTPLYNTGTVTVTDTDATVTGSGTAWSTREIGASMIFEDAGGAVIENGPYSIASITSDTELELATAYSGTTGGGKAYQIRRTFNSPSISYPIFADVWNGDLFVAGPVGGGAGAIPTIIKIKDVYDSGVAASDAIYAMSAEDLDGTMTAGDNLLGELLEILGMQFLADGRVIVAAWSNESGVDIKNRVYYSANYDVGGVDMHKVWTASPGGFNDITDLPGRLTGLGKWGRSVTVHFPEGIVLGHLTGQDDPPLQYMPAALVSSGCEAPRTLRRTPIGELYLGSDHNVFHFDGNRAIPIGEDIKDTIAEDWGYDTAAHSSLDLQLDHAPVAKRGARD